MKEASKKWGVPEHIVESVSPNLYALPYEKMKAQAVKALRARGIVGGVHIFHAFRYANYQESLEKGVPQGWYFSPHFHILGFIDGGYSDCRHCSNAWLDSDGQVCIKYPEKCLVCGGFEGRTRRIYEKEGGKAGGGFIVKVMGARKSVKGSAWYQLNHATIVKGHERAKVATWFGVCSYTKLKLAKADRVKNVCPLCGEELVRLKYVGSEACSYSDWWEREFEGKYLDDDGRPLWILAPEKR